MKFVFLAPTLALALFVSVSAQESPSHRIDLLIEAAYKTHKVTPNKPASDEIFCRRVYLDVIGRIPSKQELMSFLNDTAPDKRSKLIDKLLESEGYVSYWYNYWADILRIQSGMRNQAGAAYAQWVKDALRNNMPYDQFVRELVGAKGYIWDNGAVGYYMRDAGMPLDNMSNTAQIFLGTRVVCAQCHNHPFDKWKQVDYYQMAAFTYGVKTELSAKDICPEVFDGKKMTRAEKKLKKDGGPSVADLERTINEILEPLSYGVVEKPHDLKLPGDFKYTEDGSPNQPVSTAQTLFGLDRIDKEGVKSKVDGKGMMREDLVAWMTDKQNPRFTIVICNRLWKRCFGIGLIEPVDDFKDDTVASNQALMKFLCDEMVRYKYDMRKFLKLILNTKTYQRECTATDVSEEVPYYFPGPVLRRMSAEQVWDSVVTLMIPNPDLRKRGNGYSKELEEMKAKAAELTAKYVDNPQGSKNLIELATLVYQVGAEHDMKIAEARNKLNDARAKKDAQAEKAAQAALLKANEDKENAVAAARANGEKAIAAKKAEKGLISFDDKPLAMDRKKDDKTMMMGGKEMSESKSKEMMASQSDYANYNENYFRASELGSPAPAGHFLREFGQSNREVIENSWNDASVPQVLMLMNGQVFEDLTGAQSQVTKALEYALTPNERANNLFLTVLGRYPTDKEKQIVAENSKGKDAWKEIFWALLNGREFIFIQ